MWNPFSVSKFVERWILSMLIFVLALTLLMVPDGLVEANTDTAFNADDHGGKFVELGGRKWVVVDVVDGKPYLLMDSIYAQKLWNSEGDSSDASEIFQYLEDEFENMITVAEDRDLIDETVWEIRSMKFGDSYSDFPTTGGQNISPSSFTQKLGLISLKDIMDSERCDRMNQVLGGIIWTITPDFDSFGKAYGIGSSGFGCGGESISVQVPQGIQPVLYLKDSVRIKGGEGTADKPYVLSVSDDPLPANIKADGTSDEVTVQNVPAGTTVKVYDDINSTTPIGSEKNNGDSSGTIVVSVSKDLRWQDNVYVSLTQPGKLESNKVEVTVIDEDPPTIGFSISPTSLTNQNVTVMAEITDGGSDIVVKKWALGVRTVDYFKTPGAGNDLIGDTFEVQENGNYTVYAKDAAGNDSVENITIDNIDRTVPTLLNVHIGSTNPNSEWAKVGDDIIVTFEASEILDALIKVTIAGNIANVEHMSGKTYRATYTMQATDEPEGVIPFSIEYRDMAGNVGAPVSSTSDGSQVQFDRTAPSVINVSIQSSNDRPDLAKVGDEIELTFEVSEELSTLPKVTIAGNSAAVEHTDDKTYHAKYMMQETDPEGIVSFLIDEYRDMVGNVGDSVANTSDDSQVEFDRTAPSVTNVSIKSNNDNPALAKVGDEIELTFEASEKLSALPKVTIAGNTAAVEHLGGWKYRATYTMQETDSEGIITFLIHYRDIAGNAGTPVSITSDKSQVEFDRSGPEAPSFTVDIEAPTNGEVTVTIHYPADAYLRQFRMSKEEPWKDYMAPIVMSDNGTVFARSIDQAGNQSEEFSYVVNNIDKDKPMIGTPVFHPDKLTNQDVTVTVAVYDMSNKIVDTRWSIGVQPVEYFELGGTPFTGSFVVKMNGDYTIYALDEAGNASVASFKLSHIFREKPDITLTAMPTVPTNGSVTVTASVYAQHGVEVQKFDFGKHPLEYFTAGGKVLGPDPIEMKDNGWLSVYVRDTVGNESVEHLEITNIDRDKPIIQLIGNDSMRVSRGSKFIDPGATAWDKQDGDLSDAIVSTGDVVDTNRSGTYYVEYRVADRAGNEADPVIRTVTVYRPKSKDQTTIPPIEPDDSEETVEETEGTDPLEPEDVIDGIDPIESDDEKMQPLHFSDTEHHWAQHAIQQLSARGIISGYPDGSFRPDNPITRAEFIVMLIHVLEQEEVDVELDFVDHEHIGPWAKRAIAQALKLGIVHGYEDGTFRPSRQMTRAEMCTMLARAIGFGDETVAQTSFVDDQDIPSWAKASVEALRRQGIVQGRGDNMFVPNAPATRAEVAVIMLSLIRIMED